MQLCTYEIVVVTDEVRLVQDQGWRRKLSVKSRRSRRGLDTRII